MENETNVEGTFTRPKGSIVRKMEDGKNVVLVKLQCRGCNRLNFVKALRSNDVKETDKETIEHLNKYFKDNHNTMYNCGTCGSSKDVQVYEHYNLRRHDREII